MVVRSQILHKNKDLLIFGARGTGKTTLLKSTYGKSKVLWIDFLTELDEERFGRHPDLLVGHLSEVDYDFVVIDEVQKFPKILDIVHGLIEAKRKKRPYFILTGSSARKLKRSGANLLGGRLSTKLLFPFTQIELKHQFDLQTALEYGTLPLCWARELPNEKSEFLRDYIRNYVKEEVLVEQLLRRIDPFRDFLEVAAQMNGQIVNYLKISRDVGVSDQTVRSFFQILEDTLIGFSLPAFHRSIRKRQRESPKFYFFDCGVRRALNRTLKVPLIPGSSDYGNAFEHHVILEIFRNCEYLQNDFRLSYLRTKDDAEIDLIIERPGQPDLLLEIKSNDAVDTQDANHLQRFLNDWDRPAIAQIWSRDPITQKIGDVHCFDWTTGLSKILSNS